MSIQIQMSKNLEDTYPEAKIHYLPFKVKADGAAKTEKYFNSTIRSDESGALTASFRGYPLNGQKLDVPTGYTGMFLRETIKPLTEDDNRKFYVTHKFNSFTYWNWDKIPSKNDTIREAMEWIDIAEALHAPVEEEELKQ